MTRVCQSRSASSRFCDTCRSEQRGQTDTILQMTECPGERPHNHDNLDLLLWARKSGTLCNQRYIRKRDQDAPLVVSSGGRVTQQLRLRCPAQRAITHMHTFSALEPANGRKTTVQYVRHRKERRQQVGPSGRRNPLPKISRGDDLTRKTRKTVTVLL